MNQTEFLTKHQEILDTIHNITANKNRDYSKEADAFANFEMVQKFGITDTASGILVRMCDKFARICNLVKQEAKVKDETIIDTLIDLANYAVICTVYLQDKETKDGKKSS
jgi:hypothetical protein